MVALPAVGALFVAHLAHQDWHRMEQERENRNVWAARSFMVAFVGDAMDVAFHVVVVLGLLYTHFQVGGDNVLMGHTRVCRVIFRSFYMCNLSNERDVCLSLGQRWGSRPEDVKHRFTC